jgi:hypothetical protein
VRIAGGRRLQGTLRHVTFYMISCTANVSQIGVHREGSNSNTFFSDNGPLVYIIITPTSRDLGKISASTGSKTQLDSLLIREDKAPMGLTRKPA